MKIQDKTTINAPMDAVFEFLTDAHRVAPCAPGVEGVEEIEQFKKYKALASVGFGNMKVKFNTELEFLEMTAPDFAKIKAHGKAPGSAVDVIATMNLTAIDDSVTEIAWEAEVNILGTIASLATRMMVPVTKKMTGEFFGCVKKNLEG